MHKEKIPVSDDVSLSVYSRSPGAFYEGLFLGYPLAELATGMGESRYPILPGGVKVMVNMERRGQHGVYYAGFVPFAKYDPKKGLVDTGMARTRIHPLFTAELTDSPDKIASQMFKFVDENLAAQKEKGFDPAVVFAEYKYGLCSGHIVDDAVNDYGLRLLEGDGKQIERLRATQHTDEVIRSAFGRQRGDVVQLPVSVKDHLVDLLYEPEKIEDFFGVEAR